MPHVVVQLLEGRTAEQKRATAKAITDAMVEHCAAPREGTTVVFLEVPRDSWARAGVVIADREAQARPAGS